jgi:hypothetical protein
MRWARRVLWPALAAAGVGAEAVGFGFDDPVTWIADPAIARRGRASVSTDV